MFFQRQVKLAKSDHIQRPFIILLKYNYYILLHRMDMQLISHLLTHNKSYLYLYSKINFVYIDLKTIQKSNLLAHCYNFKIIKIASFPFLVSFFISSMRHV